MGEGEGGGGQNKDLLVPLPSIPSRQWRGDYWEAYKMLEENSQI